MALVCAGVGLISRHRRAAIGIIRRLSMRGHGWHGCHGRIAKEASDRSVF